MLVDANRSGAHDAGQSHAARNHCGVAGLASHSRQDPFGNFHAVDVVRRGFLADQDHRTLLRSFHRVFGREDRTSHRRARGCINAVGEFGQLRQGLRIEHGMQQLIELFGRHAQHCFLFRNHALARHVDGHSDCGSAGAFAIAGLQHVELAILDGELEILHVAIVFFEAAGNLLQLPVGVGHDGFQLRDRLRRANAGHHILALRIDQELAPENFFAGGWIAREADAGARGVAHVAEHHGLHVGGGTQVVRDFFHAPVSGCVRSPPGAEHSVARHGELLMSILGKRLAGLFLDQLFVVGDDGFQVGGGEVGIQFDLGFVLALVKDVVEFPHVDVERHFSEHLDKAAIAIVCEARVSADLGQALDGLIVQAEVEDGVHHAGHGELRAGTNAEQQRIGAVAQPFAHLRFQVGQRLRDLLFDVFRDGVLIVEIDIADFGGDGEARRDRYAGLAHFSEARAFAAEHIFHRSISIGFSAAEGENVFVHKSSLVPQFFGSLVSVAISEKSAIRSKSRRMLFRNVSRFLRTAGSGAFTSTLSKKRSIFGRSDAIRSSSGLRFVRSYSSCRSRSGPASSSAALRSSAGLNSACARMFLMRLKLAARGSKSGVGRMAWTRVRRLSRSGRSFQPAAMQARTSS